MTLLLSLFVATNSSANSDPQESMCMFLAKWIEYAPKISGQAQDLCYSGLASVLRLTNTSQELGALKIK